MKRNKLIVTFLSTVAIAFSMAGCGKNNPPAPELPKIVIDKNNVAEILPIDDGTAHQVRVENLVFDIVGYQASLGNLGSIKKTTIGSYQYNGMVYNRSVLNGLVDLTVNYSGENQLAVVFTDYFMENMKFNGQALPSGQAVQANGKGYFIIYNTSENPVTISSVVAHYSEDAQVDLKMIYNKSTELGGARSVSKSVTKEDSYLVLENDPQKNNNNYSVGKTSGHANNDSWYRWNGKYFVASEDLGTDFTFTMTLGIGYDRMTNPEKYFHINCWPQFSYGDTSDEQWVQTYIGNDNYEPLGADHALRPTDPYAQDSFAGRFFTNYDWYNSSWEVDYEGAGNWLFADPDVVKIPDEGKDLTMRQAYEQFNLPFWCIKFHVYLGQDNDAYVDIKINDMLVYSTYIFENYNTETTPSIHLRTLPMHLVNYGVDAEGNPGESYTGMFTYPRLVA